MSNFSWEEVITHIDELVMDAVESSTADLATVIKLHDKLVEIAEMTENSDYPGITQISQKTADLAMSIVLQEAKDPEKNLDCVIESTSCLQCMVREILRGGSPLYIPIPGGLGLNSEILFGKKQPSVVLVPVKDASKASTPAPADLPIAPPPPAISAPKQTIPTPPPQIPIPPPPQTPTPPPQVFEPIPEPTQQPPTKIAQPKATPKFVNYPEFEMGSLTPSHLADFLNELYELIQKSESILLEIDKSAEQNPQSIQELFGVFHTIKGISGIIKLQKIIELSHKAEILLEKVPLLNDEAIHTLFECIDVFKAYGQSIQYYQDTKEFLEVPETQVLVAKLEAMRIQIESVAKKATSTGKVAREPEMAKPQISEQPSKEKKPLPEIMEMTMEEMVKEVVHDTKSDGQIKAVEIESKTSELAVNSNTESYKDYERMETVEKVPEKSLPKIDVKESSAYSIDSIKITTQRLDMLMDAVGELVIAQSMLENDPDILGLKRSETTRNLNTIRKITRELQKLSMSMRMVTIQSTFQAMERLVRDLAHNQNKSIEVSVSGEHTELDRNIVDAMYNPLIHLVRNAVGHGIEQPNIRKEKGKQPKGKISFNAYHRGGNIVIEIKDDGQGLQREKILQKGINQGLIEATQEYSNDAIYQLIFMPGFTTAEVIDEVSGRGVGLDVVKKSVEKLRGRIEIFTEVNQGTTFRLTLPLTLAIIEGMLIRLNDNRYIIPLINIEEFVQITDEQLSNVMKQGKLLLLRGSTLPVFDLEKLLQNQSAETKRAIGVVVSYENKRYCFLVDELLGQQQVVIKSLGSDFQHMVGVSGAAILGDGRVGLILDVQDLVHRGLVG